MSSECDLFRFALCHGSIRSCVTKQIIALLGSGHSICSQVEWVPFSSPCPENLNKTTAVNHMDISILFHSHFHPAKSTQCPSSSSSSWKAPTQRRFTPLAHRRALSCLKFLPSRRIPGLFSYKRLCFTLGPAVISPQLPGFRCTFSVLATPPPLRFADSGGGFFACLF